MISELWGITCFYNPAGFTTKLPNYQRFRAALGIPCITVECAFGSAPFVLPPTSDVVHVRARDVLWQKERLLNVALSHLPAYCTKVAWLDGDLLFQSPTWAEDTAALLDTHAVVQPFTSAVRLGRGALVDDGTGERFTSYAARVAEDPGVVARGSFDLHGHTGFAWAARRELLTRHGIYDACIAGSGDHMMAHAFVGDLESACIPRIFGDNHAHRDHFARWARGVFGDMRDMRAGLGVTPGVVHHLWHGDMKDRQYLARNRQLAALRFTPERDLRVGPSGAWELSPLQPELRAFVTAYFASRNEDGEGV